MKRWVGGSLLTSATATALLFACDLDLKPFVESPDVLFSDINRDTGVVGDAAGGGDATDGGDGAPEIDAAGLKRVFVTSAGVIGQFLGADGGDTVCNSLATEARLGGKFVAWVSVAGAPAIGRVTGNGPFYLVDRKTLIFPTKNAIITTFAENPIDRDEKGAKIDGNRRVWTGTLSNGTAAAITQTCTNFSGIVGSGMAGDATEKDAKWTQAGVQACSEQLRLYCFEQ